MLTWALLAFNLVLELCAHLPPILRQGICQRLHEWAVWVARTLDTGFTG
ncbi:MAG: hypothetical protein HYV61_04905 [Candidatus Rokubacteria bacterium]|nr:hypothetical protein [Candidatus Rokubacteria bacterium]MBI2879606.1 hypothetical protein [Candidatus Rokubacteria bacterium]